MDISRAEQRILHLMAQGGRIEITRDDNEKIETVSCFTRDGWVYPGFGMELFRKLKCKPIKPPITPTASFSQL